MEAVLGVFEGRPEVSEVADPLAVHLFKELIRMHPENKAARKGLRRTFYRIKPGPVLNARAVSVLLIFAAAIVTALELLVVRHFYAVWTPVTEYTRIGLFVLGIGVLIASDVYQHQQAWKKAERFAQEARDRRPGC